MLVSDQQSTNQIQGLDELSLSILLQEHIRSMESREDRLQQIILGQVGFAKPKEGSDSTNFILTFIYRLLVLKRKLPIEKSCFSRSLNKRRVSVFVQKQTTDTNVIDDANGGNHSVGAVSQVQAKGSRS